MHLISAPEFRKFTLFTTHFTHDHLFQAPIFHSSGFPFKTNAQLLSTFSSNPRLIVAFLLLSV